LPLTGKMALIGEQVKNGSLLAEEDINAKNRKKIEVLYEDSKSDPKEGVVVANKLIDINNVKYIHVVTTPIISAIQPIIEERGVVMTAVSISPAILKDTNFSLRTFYNQDQAVEKLNEFINWRKYSKIVAMFQNGDAWESQITQLENKGIIFIKKEKFNIDEKDFRTTLLKIKNENPDTLLLLGYGSNFPAIFKQMAELKMENLKVLGGLDFLEVPGDSLSLYKNVVFVVPAFNFIQTDKTREFTNRYEQRFGSKPNHQAAYAYDTINLIYLGATQTDGSPESMIKYLKNFGEYNGVLGKTNLTNGDMRSDLSFATYQDGKLVLYELK